MKIDKIIYDGGEKGLQLSIAETRKVVDLLEASKEFENAIKYLRKKYLIPENGYPFEFPKYAQYVIFTQDKLGKFFDEAEEITNNLKLPYYWWSITKDEYNKFHQQFRKKIDDIEFKERSLQKAEDNYYLTASYLLELAGRASELFESSEVEEKRQLLKLILQNCKLKGKKLQFTLEKPFDTVLHYANRSAWLRRRDSNPQPSG